MGPESLQRRPQGGWPQVQGQRDPGSEAPLPWVPRAHPDRHPARLYLVSARVRTCAVTTIAARVAIASAPSTGIHARGPARVCVDAWTRACLAEGVCRPSSCMQLLGAHLLRPAHAPAKATATVLRAHHLPVLGLHRQNASIARGALTSASCPVEPPAVMPARPFTLE